MVEIFDVFSKNPILRYVRSVGPSTLVKFSEALPKFSGAQAPHRDAPVVI